MSAEKYIFDVSNMKCGGCVASVEKALQALDGVDTFDVNLEQHTAEVVANIDAAVIAAAITTAGYPAVLKD